MWRHIVGVDQHQRKTEEHGRGTVKRKFTKNDSSPGQSWHEELLKPTLEMKHRYADAF